MLTDLSSFIKEAKEKSQLDVWFSTRSSSDEQQTWLVQRILHILQSDNNSENLSKLPKKRLDEPDETHYIMKGQFFITNKYIDYVNLLCNWLKCFVIEWKFPRDKIGSRFNKMNFES